jgi:DNA-binding protein H-NS
VTENQLLGLVLNYTDQKNIEILKYICSKEVTLVNEAQKAEMSFAEKPQEVQDLGIIRNMSNLIGKDQFQPAKKQNKAVKPKAKKL